MKEYLQKILANSSYFEIGIICEDLNMVDSKKVDGLSKSFPNNKIESWGQIAPELGYAQEIMGSVIYAGFFGLPYFNSTFFSDYQYYDLRLVF